MTLLALASAAPLLLGTGHTAIYQYLSCPSSHTNKPTACYCSGQQHGTDRQTDGRTDRHSNVTYTLPHTMWVLSIRKQFCADYCMLLLLRCLELAGSLHSSDWPHENLSSNVSRLAQGRPACSRVERFQKSKFSRERLPCFRGCENAFGNSDC